jgi:ribonuclease P protein component
MAAQALVNLGMVVPKRHAKRSVTRTLVKRQMRAQVREQLADLPAGEWVLRLRAPIDRKTYPSASSEALAAVVRAELERLLRDAARRTRAVAAPSAPPRAASR